MHATATFDTCGGANFRERSCQVGLNSDARAAVANHTNLALKNVLYKTKSALKTFKVFVTLHNTILVKAQCKDEMSLYSVACKVTLFNEQL
jgi:hypothetical protein